MRACEYCGLSIVGKNAQARYCSDHCRNYHRRLAARVPFPAEMINANRWVRRSPTKAPLDINGRAASSTQPSSWASFEDATASHAGVGLGFVLGDGFACIDLDHCLTNGQLTDVAAAFLETLPNHYVEISPSGDGLHIWGTADPAPGTKRIESGLSVERYSTGRYITITGNVFQRGELLPLR